MKCGLVPVWGLLGAFAAAGADEAAEAEVSEDKSHGEEDESTGAGLAAYGGETEVGAVVPGGLSGEESEDAEEDAGDLKPEDAGEFDDRAPDGFAEALAATSNFFSGLAGLDGGPRCCACGGGDWA